MSLNNSIKEHRKRCGLSQEKLAEMVGVSRQAVTKWETGQSAPSTDNLIRLAEIFQIPLDALVNPAPTDAAPAPAPTAPPIPDAPFRPVIYVQPTPPVVPQSEEPSRKWTIWRKISVCLLIIGLIVLMPMGIFIARGLPSDAYATYDVLAKILGVCFYGGFGCKFIDAMIHISRKEY